MVIADRRYKLLVSRSAAQKRFAHQPSDLLVGAFVENLTAMDYQNRSDQGQARSLTIFDAEASPAFGWLVAPDASADFEHYYFDGRPRSSSWARDKYMYEKDERGLQLGTFTESTLGTLTFNHDAKKIVGPLLSTCGEILPIAVADHDDFYVFNCTTIVNALDEEVSAVDRFEDGRIMFIKRYAFLEEALPSAPFFRVTAYPRKIFCLSDSCAPERDFKRLVEQHSLTGLAFHALWKNGTTS